MEKNLGLTVVWGNAGLRNKYVQLLLPDVTHVRSVHVNGTIISKAQTDIGSATIVRDQHNILPNSTTPPPSRRHGEAVIQ